MTALWVLPLAAWACQPSGGPPSADARQEGAPGGAGAEGPGEGGGEGEGEGAGPGEGAAELRRRRYDDALAWIGDFPGRGAELQDVALVAGRAYLCSGNGGLHVIDMADPAAPVQRFPGLEGPGTALGGLGRCQHVVADGERVFASARVDLLSPRGKVLSARVADVRAPELLGLVESGLSYEGMTLVGDNLLVAAHGAGLRVLSVDGAGAIEEIGAVEAGDAWSVRAAGDLYAVAAGADGVRLLEGPTPLAAAPVGVAETGGLVRDVEWVEPGRTLAVAAGPAGVQIWDVAAPAAPALLGRAEVPGTALDVAVAGDGATVYVAAFNDVRAYDITDPTAPRLAAQERIRTTHAISRPLAVAARDDLVAVAEWSAFAVLRRAATGPAPQATARSSELDFGRMTPGVRVARVFLLDNEGDAELIVDGGLAFTTRPQGGRVFRLEAPRERVPPGGTLAVEVDAVVASADPVRGLLRLFTDDPDQRAFEVPLRANDPGLEVGEAAPPVEVPTLDGEIHRLADQAGAVVLLAWFGTYCPVCAPELSDLEVAVWRRFRDQGLVVWALNPGRGDTAGVVRTFADRLGLTFPLHWDRSDWWGRFEESDDAISAFPIHVLVGRDGRLKLVRRRYERAVLVEAIGRALAEAAP